MSCTQLQVALFALEIWTVRVRCLWCRLRSTSCRCFSCAVHSAISTSHNQSGVVRIRNKVGHGMWHKSLSSYTWEVSYETLPVFVSVRQHFGGLRHHGFWLQRQNMDVCPVHSSRWRCSPLKSGHYFYGPSFLFVFDVCGLAWGIHDV